MRLRNRPFPTWHEVLEVLSAPRIPAGRDHAEGAETAFGVKCTNDSERQETQCHVDSRTRLGQMRSRPQTANGRRGAGHIRPAARPAGWWRDDHVEQLRNYQSWVYAAVNAIAQEVARQRPFLYRNTGQADHEQTPLPHTHPLSRLLDHPNPWLTPWELWYLTVVYLELTGNCFWYVAPHRSATRGSARRASCGSSRRRGCASSPIATQLREGATRSRVPGVPAEVFAPGRDHSPQVPEPARPALRPVAAAGERPDGRRQHRAAEEPLPDVPRRPAAGRRAADRPDADRADGARGSKRSSRRSSAAGRTGTGRWCSNRA